MGADETQQIPIVDISAFTLSCGHETRKQTARELARCLRPHGCVGMTGHGVPPSLLAGAFAISQKLFDLPLEDKMKAPHPDALTPHRGYSATGREKLGGKGAADTGDQARRKELVKISDYEESYEIGSEENTEQYNIWLPEPVLPGFRTFATQLFWRLSETSAAILEALIMSIGLDEQESNAVKTLHSGHDNQLRLLHYPPIPQEMFKQEHLTRLGEHSDWRQVPLSFTATFTLLFQSHRGGLEFANRETGGFMPATPTGDMLYMNIGDMFMRISNGFYPSATHRVSIPDFSKQNSEATPARYSIPYFAAPDADGIIEPQPSRVRVDKKVLYEPTTLRKYSDGIYKATQIWDD